MRYPSAIGPSYRSQGYTADQEEVYNWYLERMESQGATSDSAYYPIPGVDTILDASLANNVIGNTTDGVGRASFSLTYAGQEMQILVIGGEVYKYVNTSILTNIGSVAVNSNPATISYNGDGGAQIMITSGDNLYIYDLVASTFTQISSMDGMARFGGYLDGYFVALDATNSTFYISDLLDGSTWDPTQFAQRSIGADPWVGMAISNRYIYLFGTLTSEVWYNAGNYPFPFAFYPSGFINYGTAAPFSAAVADGAITWLGSSDQGTGFVCRATGFNPEIISTFPMQWQIGQYVRISDAIGDTYNQAGHTFYILTFPSGDVTWAWDSQTTEWAKRGTWSSAETKYFAWRPLFHSFAFNRNTMLDRSGSKFYNMQLDFAYDADEIPIRYMRRFPTLNKENRRLFYPYIEFLMDVGIGDEESENPQAQMRISNDGGQTWGSYRQTPLGKVGEYYVRVRYNRCGMARKRVFELVISDPVKPKLIDVSVGIIGLEDSAA